MAHAKRIAILATDGFEQSELMGPRKLLKEAGFHVDVIAPKGGQIRGWNKKDWGDTVPVDVELSKASPGDYDALVLPGGQMNPDTLRMEAAAVEFVRAFDQAGKPLAAICHGPWLLVEAGAANGREGRRSGDRCAPDHQPQARRHPCLHRRGGPRPAVMRRLAVRARPAGVKS